MMNRRTLSDPRAFGRRAVPVAAVMAAPKASMVDDFKLFLMTFAGGFLFMTVYLA